MQSFVCSEPLLVAHYWISHVAAHIYQMTIQINSSHKHTHKQNPTIRCILGNVEFPTRSCSNQTTPLQRLTRMVKLFIDFSLTVKAATLIFISGLGSAILSAKDGKSGSIYNLVKNKEVVWAAQTCVHFMKILTAYTLNSHLLTLKAHNHKMSSKIFEASYTNSVDPDQTAPVGVI